MAPKEEQSERSKKTPPFGLMPADLAAIGKERIEDLAGAQADLFEKLQESNKQWLDRVQSNVDLASEFASKMTAARSIPEAMAIYQDWFRRRLEMMAEDGKQLLADAQKFMETGAKLLSSGSSGDRPGGGIGT